MDEKKNQKFPQDSENNEYRYISAAWLDGIAVGLTAGAVKHPGETWRTIPTDEHLARAMRHINLYRKGDRSELHLVNASMRLMMAAHTDMTIMSFLMPGNGQKADIGLLKESVNELCQDRRRSSAVTGTTTFYGWER